MNFMNVNEVSDYLNISLATAYKLTQNGELPAQKVGRQWRYVKSELDRFIAGRNVGAGSGASSETSQNTGVSNETQSRDKSSDKPMEQSTSTQNSNALSAIFTAEQLATLKAFSIDSPAALIKTLATSMGRRGLLSLLQLDEQALDVIADKVVALL